MKILVLSDSHSALRFMRRCVEKIKPDHIVHLGDYYDDGEILREEYPHICVHQVPGNCDRYRAPIGAHPILDYPIDGVRMYMTHGHLHSVKRGTGMLLSAARASRAEVVLYGHTHERDCHREEDGLWVLNPGSCGHSGGSAGVLETENGRITACYLIGQADLEEQL